LADIFVSYASEDRERVSGLVDLLLAEGYSVWWDRQLKGGSVFSQEIESEIKAAQVVLGVWSESSIKSQWVADEVDIGRSENKLVPISFDSVVPPIGFRQIQTLDFSDWLADGDEEAVASLKEALSGFTFSQDGSGGDPQAEAPVKPEATIAVLPFVNMSTDPEQEYFSDGLSEELLNLLAKVEDLRVAARTSSFQFKDQNLDVSEIGEKLGVYYVLEGSVRKAGKRVRITAQLIEATDGFHLWSQTYDRTLEDIFAIQDEISAAIVEELKKVVLGDVSAPESERSDNIEAYDYFLLAKESGRVGTNDALRKVEKLLKRSLDLDPDFAPAHVMLGRNYFVMSTMPGGAGMISVEEAIEEGLPHLKKALELAPDLPEAHAGMANYYKVTHDYDRAEEMVNAALALNPNEVSAYRELTFVKLFQADPHFDSVALHRKIVSVDPLNVAALGNLSTHLVEYGKFEECEELLERMKQIVPEGNSTDVFREMEIQTFKMNCADVLGLLIKNREATARVPGILAFVFDSYALGLGPLIEHIDAHQAAAAYILLGDRAGLKRTAKVMRSQPARFDEYRRSLWLAVHDAQAGDFRQALDLVARFEMPEPGKWGRHFNNEEFMIGAQMSVYLRQQLGDKEGAALWLAKLEEAHKAKIEDPHGVVYFAHPVGVAVALFQGNKAAALDRAEMALANSMHGAVCLKGLPWFRVLDGEPRFDAVLAKIDAHIEGEKKKAHAMDLLPLPSEVEVFWGELQPVIELKV